VRERRTSVRHELKWQATIEGCDSQGIRFDEEGVIENLSATGAFFYIHRAINVGSRLNLAIRLPFKKENWMKYSAEVVRIEPAAAGTGVGIKFDTIKPLFESK
jgi:hypothetical protein